jgi:hypothetical protein
VKGINVIGIKEQKIVRINIYGINIWGTELQGINMFGIKEQKIWKKIKTIDRPKNIFFKDM